MGIGKDSPTIRETCNPLFWRDFACEAIATAIFFFARTALWLKYENVSEDPAQVTFMSAVSTGFLVYSLTEAFGHLSGAHMNPVVSLAFIFMRRITWIKAVFYVVAQIGGCGIGVGIMWLMTPASMHKNLTANDMTGVDTNEALVVEWVMSMVLVLTYFGALDYKRRPMGLPSLSLGMAYTTGILVCGPYTDSSLNPLASFEAAVISGQWSNQWIYWLGPILGAVSAAIIYKCAIYLAEKSSNKNYLKASIYGKKYVFIEDDNVITIDTRKNKAKAKTKTKTMANGGVPRLSIIEDTVIEFGLDNPIRVSDSETTSCS